MICCPSICISYDLFILFPPVLHPLAFHSRIIPVDSDAHSGKVNNFFVKLILISLTLTLSIGVESNQWALVDNTDAHPFATNTAHSIFFLENCAKSAAQIWAEYEKVQLTWLNFIFFFFFDGFVGENIFLVAWMTWLVNGLLISLLNWWMEIQRFFKLKICSGCRRSSSWRLVSLSSLIII